MVLPVRIELTTSPYQALPRGDRHTNCRHKRAFLNGSGRATCQKRVDVRKPIGGGPKPAISEQQGQEPFPPTVIVKSREGLFGGVCASIAARCDISLLFHVRCAGPK